MALYNIFESGADRVEEIDNLILTTGRMQNDSLYSAFTGKVKQVHLIGDARIGGARIGNAMYDAQNVARAI